MSWCSRGRATGRDPRRPGDAYPPGSYLADHDSAPYPILHMVSRYHARTRSCAQSSAHLSHASGSMLPARHGQSQHSVAGHCLMFSVIDPSPPELKPTHPLQKF